MYSRRGRPLSKAITPVDRALRVWMKGANIGTFRELADAAEITYVALHYYRKGQRTPGIDVISRLSKVLKVSTDQVIKVFMK